LGDIVALTGAVKALHDSYPGEFLTDVDTSYPEVWDNNPHIFRHGAGSDVIECDRVVIDRDGTRRQHYVQAYLDLLNQALGTRAVASQIGGDIHLSSEEKSWYSEIYNYCGEEVPYWIISSGGKFDIPIKWWDHSRYQEIVDAFQGRIQFVQTGAWGNHHPRLKGTIDLRGRTNIRDLIHLVYYAQGVVCGVTALMHLTSAVPTENGKSRTGVIIAGLREPRVWEAYPGHHFFTPSRDFECAHCWKQRYFTIPDRGRNNDPQLFCSNIQNRLPGCMDAIQAEEVIERMELACAKRPESFLPEAQLPLARKAVLISEGRNSFDQHNVTPINSVSLAEEFISRIPVYPRRRFAGRGIIICGGGVSYFTNAWVNIQILRMHGCKLPIELWYIGREEMDRSMEALLEPLGVRCVNAREVMNRHPFRNPLGWELKSYAVLHSRFAEVLFLDADNVATRDPKYLFDSAQYQQYGAIFWPDYKRLSARRAIWKLCGIQYRDEPEFESGQMVINKERCWKALNLAFWYNDHSEFFYRYVHGDKETFHLAWRKIGQNYAMPEFAIHPLTGTMCQHDFSGQIIFQHRNMRKWSFFGWNENIPGFQFEAECLRFLDLLRQRWDGRIQGRREFIAKNGFKLRKGTFDQLIFESVFLKNEYDLPPALGADDLVIDVGCHIGSFARACHIRGSRKILCFEAEKENARLARENLGSLPGVQVRHRAVLHVKARVESGAYPPDYAGLNTGGCGVTIQSNGRTRTVTLDEILKKAGRVRLLKLDCEGSEWPILAHSKELRRVEQICGEYHIRESHEHVSSPGPLDRKQLRKLLKRDFHEVKTILDKLNPKLGKFWASGPKSGTKSERKPSYSREQGIQPKEAIALGGSRANCRA
jgi:FkbM family methyltransferase